MVISHQTVRLFAGKLISTQGASPVHVVSDEKNKDLT